VLNTGDWIGIGSVAVMISPAIVSGLRYLSYLPLIARRMRRQGRIQMQHSRILQEIVPIVRDHEVRITGLEGRREESGQGPGAGG
jgi:hypothetical protein